LRGLKKHSMDTKLKIFIVEDDESMIKVYTRIFKSYGYTIEHTVGGREAVEKLSKMKEKPDLILLDIIMPDVNGIDVLKELKQNSLLKAVPVIALTNLSGQSHAEEAFAEGAVMYLTKSDYDPKELIAKVREAIGPREPL